MASHKPGEIITPSSFAVAPELLGRPLAKPSRRAAAMAIDLVLLAFLVKGGALFFGLAAAFAIWRASGRAGFATARPGWRKPLRIAAAVVLFLVVAGNWGFLTRPFARLASNDAGDSGDADDADSAGVVVVQGAGTTHANISGLATLGEVLALRSAKSDAEAHRIASKLVHRLRRGGMSDKDLREIQSGLAKDSSGPLPPVALKALQDAVGAAPAADSAAPANRRDSLASAYLRAATAADSDALHRLQPRLAVAFAADTLQELNATVSELRAKNRKLTDRIQRDSAQVAGKAPGLMDTFANASDELVRLLKKAGLGFGWTGLYFTAFVALMRGQTPGKRLLRLRIVRLDGRPMGWWAALERFGGYAASVATALGGFFQILWDKNRQAMHDKIAETVVVQE